MAQGNERVFFEEGSIFVSQARVVMPVYGRRGCLGGLLPLLPRAGEEQTFPTANLTSVSLTSARSPATLLGVLLIIVGANLTILGISLIPQGLVALIFGIPLIAVVIIFRKWFFGRIYFVTLATAGTNVRGFASRDQDYIRRIVQAVNEAIIARG